MYILLHTWDYLCFPEVPVLMIKKHLSKLEKRNGK
jgi:hypothetical protein